MENKLLFDNPIELTSFLRKNGLLNQRTQAICLDLATDPNNKKLLKDYLEVLTPEIIRRQMTGSPFSVPDDVDGTLRFALTENKMPVGLNISSTSAAHALLAGSSGSGKSTVFKLLAAQSLLLNRTQRRQKGKSIIWIFSKSPEMRCLLKVEKDIAVVVFDKVKLNPLEPPTGISPMQWAGVVCDLFSSLFVNIGGKGLILKSLQQLYIKFAFAGYYPSLFDLYEHLQRLQFKGSGSYRLSGYRDGVVNKLDSLLNSIGPVFDCSRGHINNLISQHAIFELHMPEDVQIFICNYLISYLFHFKLIHETGLNHLVFIDDANLIFYKGYERQDSLPQIHHLMSTVRKSKVHILAATQSHSLMGSSIHSNAYAQILFSSSYGQDVESFFRCAGIKNPEQKAYCYTLKPREAVVKFAGKDPFLVKIPEVQCE